MIAVKKDMGLNKYAIHNENGVTNSFDHSVNYLHLSIKSLNQAANGFLEG